MARSDPLLIRPIGHAVDAVVQLPGSKSYTNRSLLIAALADGHSHIAGALFSDDTKHMAESLRRLGIRTEANLAQATFDVWGEGGHIPADSADLFVGNAGTAARFLTALLALGHGTYRLDGDPRMRLRPIQPLLDGLEQLGVDAKSEAGTGCPPVVVWSNGLDGGEVTMPGDQSSQYFSALLMVGPATREGLTIHVEREMVSKPFIDLTAASMRAFSAVMSRDPGFTRLEVAGGQPYRAREYFVEPDASNASYFFAAAAITGGRVRVENLDRSSAQGDLEFLDALEGMGCAVDADDGYVEVRGPQQLRGVSVVATDYSDTALTLCALAPFAEGPTEIRGIEHTRLQESDRIAGAAAELRKLGQVVEEFPDGLRITPRPITGAVIDTYDDHRMAMAFAIAGLVAPDIAIRDPDCTAKTFPEFWDVLEGIR